MVYKIVLEVLVRVTELADAVSSTLLWRIMNCLH
jgi:hypothetical protein